LSADSRFRGVRTRATLLIDEDGDMVVDRPSKGMLSMSAVVLAGSEVLLPVFDDVAVVVAGWGRRADDQRCAPAHSARSTHLSVPTGAGEVEPDGTVLT
jgi:hypothetical protein